MKYLVLLCDGMADYPLKSLNNKTPMEVANKPNMNRLAKIGKQGLVKTIPDNLSPGSDVANLSVMGYDPKIYYTGRSPLEAASMGVELKENDLAFRCNLVSLSDETEYKDKTILDYCADDISSKEAGVLINDIQKELGNEIFRFTAGVSYRHLLVWSNCMDHKGEYTPPHDITGKKIRNYLPKGEESDLLLDLMIKSYKILNNHPINLERIKKGKRPANSIWLWGYGRKCPLTPFYEKFCLKGAVVSAVDLIKGIGISAKMESINVDGATGYLDTNFIGKTEAALNALDNGFDYVYLHFEAPDECGHRGEIANKVKSIEILDSVVLDEILKRMEKYDDYKILIMPDHPTPLSTKTHSRDAVPFLIYQKSKKISSNVELFSENESKKTNIYFENCNLLVEEFLNK